MTAANFGDIMDDLAVQLDTVTGLRVFAFPPKSATPPFAFVNMPDVVAYDLTFGRGMDRFTFEVWVGIADVVDRATRAKCAQFAAGSGSLSIKQAIEASTVHDYRVTEAKFQSFTLGAVQYSGIMLTVDVGA